MEYVFGTKGEIEVLRAKGAKHSDLTGYHEVTREYPDQKITDRFRVVRKLDSREDQEGNCYDWYEIDRHYRITDRTGPLAEQTQQRDANIEDAMCEMDAATQDRIAAIEDALCDMDEILNGGATE